MKRLSLLVLTALTMTSCWTRIWTVAPTTETVVPVKTVYTTQVTTPTPKVTTTTTVTVTSFNNDMSFYLDLNAVAAAFAESRNIQEFEQLLNSPRYMINNLDLNRDGWIDYLRVIETHQGYYHTLLIQACLAPSVFQDVATLVAERRANTLYVDVVGDPYLYGYNYIVRPTFIKRPPMWDYYGRPNYSPWVSPYYYGYYPSYYTHPKPIYLSHYQAYVNTYITNHHYCHHCDYPSQPFYNGYGSMTQPYVRHDYQTQHPNDSFEHRVTNNLTPSGSGVTVRNAGQLRTETQRQAQASESTRTSGTTTSGTSGTTTRQSGTTTTQTQQQTQQRQPASTTTTPTTKTQTTVETRVNKSGTTRTTIKTTDTNGRTTTTKREASNREAAPARSQSSTTSTRSSSNSSSTRSSSSSTTTSGSGTSTRTRR